ncbi:MAG: lipopolysaccharide biosynthesis protein RfbH [Candidatus Bathyarchaeota archaeon]
MPQSRDQEIKERLDKTIQEFFRKKKSETRFVPGKTKVQYSGPVFDEREVQAIIDTLLEGWLAEGRKAREFERAFAEFVDAKECVVTNSGSSALMLSFATLTNKTLKKPFKKGDEVITVALTFPSTINAIILNGLRPVFVDVEFDTYNMNPALIEKMTTKRTRAILVLHHLGNPCEMDRIMEIAKMFDLRVVEDCCDAHGSVFQEKHVGSFGDMGCFSFYAAHTMTMGEGGAIVTNNPAYEPILRSLKTNGRACACSVCKVAVNPNYQCPYRWVQSETETEIYDKRTLFLNIGYKSRIMDLQAAFGLEQLKKMPLFMKQRRRNFEHMVKGLRSYEQYLVLPKATRGSDPIWFAIPLTIRNKAPFTRRELVEWLENHNVETRLLLGGNLLRHPAYKSFRFKTTDLPNTNFFHTNSFYIGCYPGIDEERREYLISVFDRFFKKL